MIVTELSVNAKSINIFKYNYFPSFLGCLKMKNFADQERLKNS